MVLLRCYLESSCELMSQLVWIHPHHQQLPTMFAVNGRSRCTAAWWGLGVDMAQISKLAGSTTLTNGHGKTFGNRF